MEVIATGTEKSSEEDRARIRELMGASARTIDDNDQSAVIATCIESGADILIAGGRYLYTAPKARLAFLDINHERDFGYAGYDGFVELARQLALAVHSPVWQRVRQEPRWVRASASTALLEKA